MSTLALDGRLIYVAHWPKAGGTSVERFMVERWGVAVEMLGWGWDRHWAGRGARAEEAARPAAVLCLGGCAAAAAACARSRLRRGARSGRPDGQRVPLPAGS
jgi:hypothetical protein